MKNYCILLLLWPVILCGQNKINTKFVPPEKRTPPTKCNSYFVGDVDMTASSDCHIIFYVSDDLKNLLLRLYPEDKQELKLVFAGFKIHKLPDDTVYRDREIILPNGEYVNVLDKWTTEGAVYYTLKSKEYFSPGREMYWSGFLIKGKTLPDYLVDIYHQFPSDFPEIKKMIDENIICKIPGTRNMQFKFECIN